MKDEVRRGKGLFINVLLFIIAAGTSIDVHGSSKDSLSFDKRRYIHRISIDAHPELILPTNDFVRGVNKSLQPFDHSASAHLKYSFQIHPNSVLDRIFGGAYQGVGIAAYTLGDKEQLGAPLAIYIFQGARLARLSHRISLNYEWNFGLSTGWKPYDPDTNPYNVIIGSKRNAYVNADIYLNWVLSRKLDLSTGLSLSHFSNGNTRFPNAGLNLAGVKVGLNYHFNRETGFFTNAMLQSSPPDFPRHISYDVVLFGSWRRKAVVYGDKQIPTPDSHLVTGFNFAPMYNLGYNFRAGISLDGSYDGSANIFIPEEYFSVSSRPPSPEERRRNYVAHYDEKPTFRRPSFEKQLALGLSGRAEFVMPIFSVNIGFGANLYHAGEDIKTFYQILALKIKTSRHTFLHIGYCLQNFNTPNYLMLGVGVRFNNKYPGFCL